LTAYSYTTVEDPDIGEKFSCHFSRIALLPSTVITDSRVPGESCEGFGTKSSRSYFNYTEFLKTEKQTLKISLKLLLDKLYNNTNVQLSLWSAVRRELGVYNSSLHWIFPILYFVCGGTLALAAIILKSLVGYRHWFRDAETKENEALNL